MTTPANDKNYESAWWWRNKANLDLACTKGCLRDAWYYEIEKRIVGEYRFGVPYYELSASRIMGCKAIWGHALHVNAAELKAEMPAHGERSPHQLEIRLLIDLGASDKRLLEEFYPIVEKYQTSYRVTPEGARERKLSPAIKISWDATEEHPFISKSHVQLVLEIDLRASKTHLKDEFLRIVKAKRQERNIKRPGWGRGKGRNRISRTWEHIEFLDQRGTIKTNDRWNGETLDDGERSTVSKAVFAYLEATWGALSDEQRALFKAGNYEQLRGTKFDSPPTIRWTVTIPPDLDPEKEVIQWTKKEGFRHPEI